MKRIITNLLLLLLALMLALGGLEVFFRKTHFLGARISWAVADPLLGWRMAPGHGYVYVHENSHPVPFSINRYGWRDKDWAQEKPVGTYRVAVLGDSYVEALQVEREATFPVLAEKTLRQRTDRPVEIMNFGRSCNTQSEELLILQNDVLPFQPDLVVLFYFAVNDIGDLDPATSLTLMRPFYREDPENGRLILDTDFSRSREFRIKQRVDPLKHHSALVSLLTERFIILQRVRQARQTGLLGDDPDAEKKLKAYLSLATSTPEPAYEKSYRLSKRLIEEMQRLCQARGIRFMLVNIDLPWYAPEVERKFKSVDPSFSADFFEKDLRSFAEAKGLLFLDLQDLFRQRYLATGKTLHFKYWDTLGTRGYWEYGAHTGHWNLEGHEAVAEALAGSLAAVIPPQKEESRP